MTGDALLIYFFMYMFLVDMKDNGLAEDHVAGSLEAYNRSEDLLPGIR